MKYYEHLTPDDFDNEVWKPINGYQNYMISNIGRVKSLNYKMTGKEQILKPRVDAKGYLVLNLSKNGEIKTIKTHRLVAQIFIDNPYSKPQVNHKNGVKTDNRKENLEWATHKENTTHAWDTGLYEATRESLTGENNGSCKLTDLECDQIRLKYSKGNILQRELAEEFGCCAQHISNIINNKNRSTPTPKNNK